MKYKVRLITNFRAKTEPGFFFMRNEFDAIVYRSEKVLDGLSDTVDFIITAERGQSGKVYYNQSSTGYYFAKYGEGDPVVLSSIDAYSFVTGLDDLWDDIVDQWNCGAFNGEISDELVNNILSDINPFPAEGAMIKFSPDPILYATTRLRWIVINHSPVLHQWFSNNQGGGEWIPVEFGGKEAP